jgi:hypothetical protein
MNEFYRVESSKTPVPPLEEEKKNDESRLGRQGEMKRESKFDDKQSQER